MRWTLGYHYDRLMERRSTWTSLQRNVTEQDVAETIFSLIASNPFVTGETIVVDGGYAATSCARRADGPGQIVLDHRPDGLNQILGTGSGRTWHFEDVAGEHQAPDVGADERGAQLAAVIGQDITERRQDERTEDVTQQPGGAVVGQAGPEYGHHLLADLGALLPQPDEPSYQLFPGPVGSGPVGRGGGQAGEHGGGIGWRLERGEK